MPALALFVRAAAVLALLAPGPALAVDAVTGAPLVMRLGPGAEHPSRGEIPADSRMRVHGCIEAEQWCLVRFGGRHGWVDGLELEMAERSPSPARRAVPLGPDHGAAPPGPGLIVPMPVAPLRPVTAEDLVIGIGERFGLAARYGAAPGQKILLAQPRGGPLVIKTHRARHRFAGHRLKSRFRLARPAFHSFRARVAKPAFAAPRFAGRFHPPALGPHASVRSRLAVGHRPARRGPGLAVRRGAPAAAGGLPVRGGWRP